jgi:mono/diheme cytochrome c family protein
MQPKTQMRLVRLWHAALVGGFAVAYLTGDEDTYSMHLFAGWLVVGLVALRFAFPLPLMRPNRPRLFNWGILAALVMAGVAAISGVGADMLPWLEDLHEGLAGISLWVALAHVAAALVVFKGRKWLSRLKPAAAVAALVVVLAASQTALAADAARNAILAAYAQQAKSENPAFAGFSAQRGEALYRAKNTVNPDAASCAACHTDDPTRTGRHVKTGRVIEPVAVSANPKRFTDGEKVEERFVRDCKSILGRACSATEKGDYVTFMASR